jgi:hypothetical protein
MDENEFIPKDGDLVLRDDQAEYFAILDEAKERWKRGARLRLIDSGHLSVLELERLCLSGVEIFTSDKAGRTPADLTVLNAAAQKNGGLIAHFHHGPLLPDTSDEVLSLGALRDAARRGVYLYLSNKTETRRTEDLMVLAEEALLGGRRVGYYHHGAPTPVLEELARRGAWIHVSADPETADSSTVLLRDIAAEAVTAGAGLVIHLEQWVPAPTIEDLWKAGAYLLFRTPPSDYRSPYRMLEEKAARRPLDPRAYYLYSEFMR